MTISKVTIETIKINSSLLRSDNRQQAILTNCINERELPDINKPIYVYILLFIIRNLVLMRAINLRKGDSYADEPVTPSLNLNDL